MLCHTIALRVITGTLAVQSPTRVDDGLWSVHVTDEHGFLIRTFDFRIYVPCEYIYSLQYCAYLCMI